MVQAWRLLSIVTRGSFGRSRGQGGCLGRDFLGTGVFNLELHSPPRPRPGVNHISLLTPGGAFFVTTGFPPAIRMPHAS